MATGSTDSGVVGTLTLTTGASAQNNSGALSITTGDAVSGDSGAITLTTGTAGTTRGDMSLDARNVNVTAAANITLTATSLLRVASAQWNSLDNVNGFYIGLGTTPSPYEPGSFTAWADSQPIRASLEGNGGTALQAGYGGSETMYLMATRHYFQGPIRPASLTTTERDALTPVEGDMIYNVTDHKHQGYDGTVWQNFY